VSDLAELELLPHEADELATLAMELAQAHATAEDPELVDALPAHARRLPSRPTDFLLRFRAETGPGACVLRGLAVDDDAIGPSPLERRSTPDAGPTKPHAIALLLLASVLGEVFGWRTLQGGRLVQDLAPIASEAEQKTGYGSKSALDPHTEDHFHPARCDYLGLLCLRNPDGVPTDWAAIDAMELTADERRILSEPRYLFLPDPEHAHHLEAGSERPWERPAPVLFGGRDTPYLRLDAPFTRVAEHDVEAADALAALNAQALLQLAPANLQPGDVLFLDNFRAVHGRSPFTARHDGTDRWLKRVNIASDLRRSRAYRATAGSRVVA
jgi:L-asparagine oxygenase